MRSKSLTGSVFSIFRKAKMNGHISIRNIDIMNQLLEADMDFSYREFEDVVQKIAPQFGRREIETISYFASNHRPDIIYRIML